MFISSASKFDSEESKKFREQLNEFKAILVVTTLHEESSSEHTSLNNHQLKRLEKLREFFKLNSLQDEIFSQLGGVLAIVVL